MNPAYPSLLLAVTVLTGVLLLLALRFLVLTVRRRKERIPRPQHGLLIDALEEQSKRERRTAQELQALDILHRTVMQHLPSGILVLDANGEIRFANPFAQQFLAEHADKANTLQAKQPRLFEALQNTGPGEQSFALEHAGGYRTLRLNQTPMADQTLVTLVDETEMRRLEEQLRGKRDLELMGEMAGGVTHEVKNTLATISGLAQLMQFGDVEENSAKLVAEVDRLSTFIREFTYAGKRRKLNLETFPVNQWLAEQLEHWRRQAHGDKVTLEPVPEQIELTADPVLVSMVLDNLVRNGLESCAETTPASPWVTVACVQTLDGVQITVSDAGPGFPEQIRPKIFMPFVSAKAKGTGLGLFQCRKVMLEHGGRLEIKHKAPTRLICWFPNRPAGPV